MNSNKKGRKKGGKKKGQKHQKYQKKKKGEHKYMKHITPISLCVLALKLMFQHFIIKKLAIVTSISFLMSKASFLLSSLLAVKQLFHGGHQEKSDNGNGGKLEVVHIPIRKKQPEFFEREPEKDPWIYRYDQAQHNENMLENDNMEPHNTNLQSFDEIVPNAFENSNNNYNYN